MNKEVKHLNKMIDEQILLIVDAQNKHDKPPRECTNVKLYRECMVLTLRRLREELRSMNTRKDELLNAAQQMELAV